MRANRVFIRGAATLILSASLAVLAMPARAQTFQTVDNPLAGPGGSTSFTGISNGRIAGKWNNAERTAFGSLLYSNGTFTPLNYPGAAETFVEGISGNTIVGGYATAGVGG